MAYKHIMNSFEYDGKIVWHNVGPPVQIWIKPRDGIIEDKHVTAFHFHVTASPDNEFNSMVLKEDLPYLMEGPGMSFPDYVVASVASWQHQTHEELWDWLKREHFQIRLKQEINDVIAKEAESLDISDHALSAGGSLTEGTDRSSDTEELPDYLSSQSASDVLGATLAQCHSLPVDHIVYYLPDTSDLYRGAGYFGHNPRLWIEFCGVECCRSTTINMVSETPSNGVAWMKIYLAGASHQFRIRAIFQQNLNYQNKELILYIYPRSSPVHDQLSIHFDKGNKSSGSINTECDPVRATTNCTIVKCSAIPLKIEGHALVGACSTAHKNHRDLWSMLTQKDFLSGLRPESDNASDESDNEGDAEGTGIYHRMRMGDSKSDDDSTSGRASIPNVTPVVRKILVHKRSMTSSPMVTFDTMRVEFAYGGKKVQGIFIPSPGCKHFRIGIVSDSDLKSSQKSLKKFTFNMADVTGDNNSPDFASTKGLMECSGDDEMYGPPAIAIDGWTLYSAKSVAFDNHEDLWAFLVSEGFQTKLMEEKKKQAASSSSGQGPVQRPVTARDAGNEGNESDDETDVGGIDNSANNKEDDSECDTGDAVSERSVHVVEKSSHQSQSPASTIASGPAA
ncbi:hypothetical protein HD553DRAFT_357053 [Filobasidium floriforme]|uniref:uncharacterized protein n=1 Tax=Filobasidium floriforme TaxID=5210 RepID=UPI001E8D2C9F|nr:uncharacterized protein HD553DRAFT_357053 [Filobasidium floriforme]KAH8083717.1 hypothetical protein HD553DRAFT_357053 [Filobasidium floriforme]